MNTHGNYNTGNFMFHRENKTFIAELSELGLPPGISPLTTVVEEGVPNVGIVMISDLTGATVHFKLAKVDQNGSQADVDGWNFEPTKESKEQYPGCIGVKVLLIND